MIANDTLLLKNVGLLTKFAFDSFFVWAAIS
jgi:hypothetical protein